MPRILISIALALSTFFGTAQIFAQTTRTEQIEQEKATKAADVNPEAREKGDVIVTGLESFFMPEPPAVRLTFGDFRPGAGLALGAAYTSPVGRRGLWTTKAAWSINNFKQVESVLELPPVAGDRLHTSTFVKWNDAPDLPYYGLGNSTTRASEVTYGLRLVDAGFGVEGRAGRWFRYGGTVGYLGAHSHDGAGGDPVISSAFSNVSAPGLGSTPTWVHTSAFAAVDTRESQGYTQSGGLYRVTLHRYSDRGNQFTFNRTEVDLRQFIPVVHRNWVIALQGLADLTGTAQGQAVPYFLLPTVGGRDTLPGFGQYRFADRNGLLLRTELRWAASPLVDMALIFDQGKVAPRVADLDLSSLKRSLGFGVRLHGPKFTALRLEIAHSTEGWRINLAHGFSF